MSDKQNYDLTIDKIAEKIVKLHLRHTNAPKTLQLIDKDCDSRMHLRSEILQNIRENNITKAYELITQNYNITDELRQMIKKKEFLNCVSKGDYVKAVSIGKEFMQEKDIEMYCNLGYKANTTEMQDNVAELSNEEMCVEDGMTKKSAVWILWMQYQTVIYYINHMYN